MFRDAVISILATIAKQERIRISERTIVGLDRARAKGVAIGRPRVDVDYVAVRKLRADGQSFKKIAEELNISKALAFRICEQRD